jgi:hypothetical protein
MQLTITQISRKDKTSAKSGKPFESVGIKTQEYGDKWLSGFGRADNKSWKVGDTVDVNVVEKGEYLNFEMPERQKSLGYGIEDRDRLLRVEIQTQQILAIVKALAAKPENVIGPNEMPDF